MDIFSLRAALVEEYKSFSGAFVQPRDKRIAAFLEERLANADQWPDPWLSLNPSFAAGGTPAELVAEGLLHLCASRSSGSRHRPPTWGESRSCCTGIRAMPSWRPARAGRTC